MGNDYEIVRPLAKGTTGPVYAAKQLSTGALRGLKIMYAEYAADEPARQRFVNEARLGARIESDHIVQVVGAGIDPVLGRPWLAMELLEGIELTQAMAIRPQGFNAAETRDVFVQLCHAVGAAHVANITHTDIRPENIFLARSRHHQHPFMVKVLDFGIAHVVLRGTTQHTQPRSRAWMAPEQIPADAQDTPAADVWALGLVAFYLLTGRTYWQSPDLMGLEHEILSPTFAAASSRAASIGARALPDGFDDWFARCVAQAPAARFPDANACCSALLPLLDAAAARAGETSTGFFAALDRASKSVPPATNPAASLDRTPAMSPSQQVFMTNIGAAQRESHGPGATLMGQDLMPPGMFASGQQGVPSGGSSGTMLGFSAAGLSPHPQSLPHAQSGAYAPPAGYAAAPPLSASGYPQQQGYAQTAFAAPPMGQPPGAQAYAQAPAYAQGPAAVGYGAIPQPPPPSRSQKSSMLPIFGVVGALSLIGGGVGIYFATRGPEKKTTSDDAEETSRSAKPPTSATTPAKSSKVPDPPPLASTSKPKPEDRDGVTGKMVRLAGGAFQMGLVSEPGESPVRSAFVGPFEMDVTEVTVKAYAACVGAGACTAATDSVDWPGIGDLVRGYKPACNANLPAKQEHPANCLSFEDAEKFCAWAGKRLPTEEEWDYASRGGITGQPFPWGAAAPDATRTNRCGMECAQFYAKMGFTAAATYMTNDSFEFTAPVGSFPSGATATGLQDMEGNVWEWVASSFCPYSTPGCSESKKVIRGRSYDDYLPNMSVGPVRAPAVATSRLPSVGFRCARAASAAIP